jgi:phage-related protein
VAGAGATVEPAGVWRYRLGLIWLPVEGAHCVFYVATFAEEVYVLHAFEKRTRKTPARDLEVGRERFRPLVAMRRKNDGSKK